MSNPTNAGRTATVGGSVDESTPDPTTTENGAHAATTTGPIEPARVTPTDAVRIEAPNMGAASFTPAGADPKGEADARAGADTQEHAAAAPASSDQGPADQARRTDSVFSPPRYTSSEDPNAATTAALPRVGGVEDPYLTRDQRALSGAAGAPVSAVDQYAASLAASGAPTVASALQPPQGAPATPPPPPAAKAPRAPRRSRNERAPRRARLQLRHINVWSVLKFSCVLAIALFFVWLIMVGVLYGILDVMGVFSKVNDTVRQINGDAST